MIVHLLHCSIFLSSTTFCRKRQQRCSDRSVLLNTLFWKKNPADSCHPVLLHNVPFKGDKAHIHTCSAPCHKAWFEHQTIMFMCRAGATLTVTQDRSLSHQRQIKAINILVSPPPYPFASFINLGWFWCIYMSGNINAVSSRLFSFCLIYSFITSGWIAVDTASLQSD